MPDYAGLWPRPFNDLLSFLGAEVQAAVQFAGKADNPSLIFWGDGTATSVYDPGWLLAEDCAQHTSDFHGCSSWSPFQYGTPSSTQELSLVVDAYDRANDKALRATVPMVAGKKNPLMAKLHGEISIEEMALPVLAAPRYSAWTLERFAAFALHELRRSAVTARPMVNVKADPSSNAPAHKWAELSEFSGFALVDQKLSVRKAYSRTGRFWRGKVKSIEWAPGERGAREELAISAGGVDGIHFAGLWWSESGRVVARFLDVESGRALGSEWEIRPKRGLSAGMMRALTMGENSVDPLLKQQDVTFTL